MKTVFREPGFDDSATKIVGTIELADKAIEGLEWALAREQDFSSYPFIGTTRHGDLRAFKTPPIGASEVALVVFFTHGPTQVTLHAVIESVAEPEDGDPSELTDF